MTVQKWATANDVSDVTGVDVDEKAVRRAVATLETITGLIEAVDRPDITDRDRHFLKLMVAYQAAFMLDNPDIFSRADVTSAGQDGESASFRNVDSHLFAPLARKAYRRLSWRSLRLLASSGGPGTLPRTVRDVNSEAFDDRLPWVKS
ncbi:head-to-tail adaptor [Microbacterium phage OscarSo]|uniref:Head-to-tail adaptor n=1 Tax=Microbacterium phage OscarSo TaxID=2985324 RepID=A0A9X9K2R2_9CAUD|nr:head-to-tail adaptor [Microbacterium phage OscarSo]UYL87139.1 head-to-tail adaptor [Microbacterium phage OscarSo]